MADTPIYPKKAWTLLVFMAGDNNLEQFAQLDVVEMDALPSDEHLHVVVQLDSRSSATVRYHFYPGGHERVGEPLPETNTGDPKVLTQFITWGKKHFPAERTALVIWNHGTGLRDLPADFNYAGLRSGEVQPIREALQRTLFGTTLPKLMEKRRRLRSIAIDATDRDYLDTYELQAALANVPVQTAVANMPVKAPRVDVLGFDACLMNVVEIGYQLRGLASFMVGSQEIEPGVGWPYAEILTTLAGEPGMSPRRFAEALVNCHASATGQRRLSGSGITQSAFDLEQVERTFDFVKGLTAVLTDEVLNQTKVKAAFQQMHRQVKRFRDRDLVDLVDWCELLYQQTKGQAGGAFRDPLIALQEHLRPEAGLIVATHAHGNDDADRIHGASIYWPQAGYSTLYDQLDFARSGWGQLAQRSSMS